MAKHDKSAGKKIRRSRVCSGQTHPKERRHSRSLEHGSKCLGRIKWHEWDVDRIVHALINSNLNSFKLWNIVYEKLIYQLDTKLQEVLSVLANHGYSRKRMKIARENTSRQELFLPRLVLSNIHEADLCTDLLYGRDHSGNLWHYWHVGSDYGPDPPQSIYQCEGCGSDVTQGWARFRWGPDYSRYYSFRVFCDRCTTVSRYRSRYGKKEQ